MDKYHSLLELNKILDEAASLAHSFSGAEYIKKLIPAPSRELALRELELTAEACNTMSEERIYPNFNFESDTECFEKLKVQMSLTLSELLKIGKSLKCARLVKTSISASTAEGIKDITKGLTVARDIEERLEKSILSDTEMADSASSKLFDVRKKIRLCGDEIRNKLNSYTRLSELAPFLQDNIVTMRGGRYVVPVKQEHRGSVKGLIHDRSSSGNTVFVEPIAIVELNNDLKLLLLEEENEVNRIIAELSALCGGVLDGLIVNHELLTVLDAIFARANYALSSRAVMPVLSKDRVIRIVRGRHPLLGKKAVPLDLHLQKRLLLISGPNAGGKTVALKTVGLFALMCGCGFFLPCDEAEMFYFDRVFCDIGDEQSIENALSTFSSHVSNLKAILAGLTSSSLVLLDEAGAGTDPLEGAALATAIVKRLIKSGCLSIVTTHYFELKEFALSCGDIYNASMQFDSETFSPTYKLISGVPGSSNALAICKRLGLDAELLKDASDNLSPSKISFDGILREAERTRAAAEAELEKYQALTADLEKRLEQASREKERYSELNEKIKRDAKAEARLRVASYIEDADELINKLKEAVKGEDERALFEARRINNQLKDVLYKSDEALDSELEPIDPSKVKVGDRVTIIKHGLEGKIISFDAKRGEARVSAGNAVLTTKLSELAAAKPEPVVKSEPVKASPVRENQEPVMREIKLLGCTVEDAIFQLDDFFMEAMSADVTFIKIVHGVGTGALRRGIQSYLRGLDYVKEFRQGGHGEGGLGVTIVKIK